MKTQLNPEIANAESVMLSLLPSRFLPESTNTLKCHNELFANS